MFTSLSKFFNCFWTFYKIYIEKEIKIRIIALDLPGFGGYSSLPKNNFTLEEYAKTIEDFILSFRFKKYFVLGYSYGGFLLSYILNKKIIKPEKVILISSFYNGKELLKYQPNLINMRYFVLIKPGSFLNYLCTIFTEYQIKVSDLKIYLKIRKLDYVKNLFKEIRNMSFSICYRLLNFTKNININKSIFKKFDSLIIYSDRDLPFINKQSASLEKINVKTVLVRDEGHRHFFFNVEKSAVEILKFLSG